MTDSATFQASYSVLGPCFPVRTACLSCYGKYKHFWVCIITSIDIVNIKILSLIWVFKTTQWDGVKPNWLKINVPNLKFCGVCVDYKCDNRHYYYTPPYPCFCKYLDFVHAVSAVQATDTLQRSSDVQSSGVPGQIQTLLLLGVGHYTPADWIKGARKVKITGNFPCHIWNDHINMQNLDFFFCFWMYLWFLDWRGSWQTQEAGGGGKLPAVFSLDAPCRLWGETCSGRSL